MDFCTAALCDEAASDEEIEAALSALRGDDRVLSAAVFEPDTVAAAMRDQLPHSLEDSELAAVGARVAVRVASADDVAPVLKIARSLDGVDEAVEHLDRESLHRLVQDLDQVTPQRYCLECITGDVSLYLCDGRECASITSAQQRALEDRLEADERVASAEFVSKDEAWAQFVERLGEDTLGGVDPASLPAYYVAVLKSDVDRQAFVSDYASLSGIEDVIDSREMAQDVLRVRGLLRSLVVMPPGGD